MRVTELLIEREPIFFMQSCGEVPCGSCQSYLVCAGGVRGVCHAGCGLCALTRARALRGVICAPMARERRQSRPERSRQAEGKTRSLQRAAVGYTRLPEGRGSLRFCSKTVPSSEVACYDSQKYILRKVTALPPLPTN